MARSRSPEITASESFMKVLGVRNNLITERQTLLPDIGLQQEMRQHKIRKLCHRMMTGTVFTVLTMRSHVTLQIAMHTPSLSNLAISAAPSVEVIRLLTNFPPCVRVNQASRTPQSREHLHLIVLNAQSGKKSQAMKRFATGISVTNSH